MVTRMFPSFLGLLPVLPVFLHVRGKQCAFCIAGLALAHGNTGPATGISSRGSAPGHRHQRQHFQRHDDVRQVKAMVTGISSTAQRLVLGYLTGQKKLLSRTIPVLAKKKHLAVTLSA